VVTRLVCVGLLAGGAELGAPQPWVDATAIDGRLAPELVLDRFDAPAGARVRVVSWNVHLGADVDALAAAFDDPALAGADVVLLQEIEAHPGEDGSRAARLAEALAMNLAYAPAREEGEGTHGLAILSPHPLAAVAVMELPHAEVLVNERRRIALAADVDLDGAPLRVIDVHLDTRLSIADRMVQLRPAVIEHGDPVVVAGDLNTLPWAWAGGVIPDAPAQVAAAVDAGRAIDDFMEALGYAAPTASLGPTDDIALVEWRLDAIYPRGAEVIDAAIAGEVRVSDHLPLRVDLAR
jgi:endonuclease/exonuclease/phosphatase family metal-dependent hydrolase